MGEEPVDGLLWLKTRYEEESNLSITFSIMGTKVRLFFDFLTFYTKEVKTHTKNTGKTKPQKQRSKKIKKEKGRQKEDFL